MRRQQRGMELDRAVLGYLDEGLRHELRHVRHDADIDREVAQGRECLVAAVALELQHGNTELVGPRAQRIGLGARLLRCHEDAGDGIAALAEGVERRFAEGLLADQG